MRNECLLFTQSWYSSFIDNQWAIVSVASTCILKEFITVFLYQDCILSVVDLFPLLVTEMKNILSWNFIWFFFPQNNKNTTENSMLDFPL